MASICVKLLAYQRFFVYDRTIKEGVEKDESEAACRIYPLFHTDKKYYTEEDFADASEAVIKIARNEIFTKHGYMFEDAEINNYFMGCEWYQPMYTKETFDIEVLNDYERANMDLLVALENK